MTKNDTVAFVIFGITGDLARRKLIPALYRLLINKRLPGKVVLYGFARRDWTEEFYKNELVNSINEFVSKNEIDPSIFDDLLDGARYIQSTFEDVEGYKKLGRVLKENNIKNVLYYLATPPDEYISIIRNIGDSKLAESKSGINRIVVEKPYGNDLASAQILEEEIHKVFTEKQIYRIDHYLGKDTVQNIMVFRFANGIFEPLWNRNYVDHVQVLVSESIGVGTRAGYYDKAGVIRDVFQNHLLQLISLTAMEAPVGFNADDVRDEKVKVLAALRPMKPDDVIKNTFRAQYVSGVMDGVRVPGYKDEAGVPSTSTTETLLAARLFIDNWRWAGVPFYVLSGKRLPARITQVAIQFKQVPLSLFNWSNMAGLAPNLLVLNIQPDEGITLSFGAKTPGPINQISPVSMNFDYQKTFGIDPPEAYERLILDCLTGDATLFTRADEVKAQWAYTDRIIKAWQEFPVKNLPVYESGTWGPEGLDEFIKKDDSRAWKTS
ncbi:MAG: glucose-6-phosphate dehydrogenase [Anaerolineaceae bacterium]|nr:glucose-6-phosphate dehydrogenase [Anaerolineaceae bacterium]